MRTLFALAAFAITGIQMNAQTYCSLSGAFNSCIYNGSITSVTFSGINNNSTCTGSDYSYADYTTSVSPATITAGASATFYVTTDNINGGGVGVWIDFDHDGSFEASEFFDLGTFAGTGSNTHSALVTVPNTALSGNTHIRVRSKRSAGVTDDESCSLSSSTYKRGEVEDYFVYIVAAASCESPTDVIVDVSGGGELIEVTWTAPTPAPDHYEIRIVGPAFSGDPEDVYDVTYITADLIPDEDYLFIIRSVCDGPSYSEWDTIPFFTSSGSAKKEQTVGISPDVSVSENFKVFPNPANNRVSVKAVEGIEIQQLTLTDLFGRVVTKSTESSSIEVSGVPAGIYLLTIETAKGLQVQRISIAH